MRNSLVLAASVGQYGQCVTCHYQVDCPGTVILPRILGTVSTNDGAHVPCSPVCLTVLIAPGWKSCSELLLLGDDLETARRGPDEPKPDYGMSPERAKQAAVIASR